MEVALLPAAASSAASSAASLSAASSSPAPAVSSGATRADVSRENIDELLREALARAVRDSTKTPSHAGTVPAAGAPMAKFAPAGPGCRPTSGQHEAAVLAATATAAAVDVPSVTSDLGPSPWGRPPQGWSEAQTSHVPCQTRPSTAVPTQAPWHLPRGTQRVARPPQAQAEVPKRAAVPQPLQHAWVPPTVVAPVPPPQCPAPVQPTPPKAPAPKVPGHASSPWLEAPAVPNDAGISCTDADHGFPPAVEEILDRLRIDRPARRALWLLHLAKPTESMRILFKAMRRGNFLGNPSAFVSRCIDVSFDTM